MINETPSWEHSASAKSSAGVAMLFNRIAKKYDFLNHLLTLGIDKKWRKKAIRLLSPDVLYVLDIATGTGDLAIGTAKQERNRHIIGVDISDNMLEKAKTKIQNLNLSSQISLEKGDCMNIRFEDDSFDAITCAFGVRNFSNLDKGLKEMHRVLKKGAQIIILEFSYPKNRVIKFLYTIYFTHILPLIGKIISKDNSAYKYLPQSVKTFISGKEFCDHLIDVGFKNVMYKSFTFNICNLYYATK